MRRQEEERTGPRPIVMFLIVVACLILLALLFALIKGNLRQPPERVVTVAAWNLQVFGDKKASDPDLLAAYANRIGQYDLIILQEIRDADGSAIVTLCALAGNRTCLNSSRAGRSSSKEQYVAILNDRIRLIDATDFSPAEQPAFERPPWRLRVLADGVPLTIYAIHIKPDDAAGELSRLEALIARSSEPTERVLVMGDLNADCSYLDPSASTAFRSWRWAIRDDVDTTAGSSECAYDRIILDAEARPLLWRAGVDGRGITPAMSDHKAVWAVLATG